MMTKKERELSYVVNSPDDISGELRPNGRISWSRWFNASLWFCRALSLNMMYMPAKDGSPGYIWFSDKADPDTQQCGRELYGFRVKGTGNRTADAVTFDSSLKGWLCSLSGIRLKVARTSFTSEGPDGCSREVRYTDSYDIPEFGSPEELKLKMSVQYRFQEGI